MKLKQNYRKSGYALFLPRWYPNPLDEQLGVFVRKHARAVSAFMDVVVVYPCPIPGGAHLKVHSAGYDHVTETMVYYRPIRNPAFSWLNGFRYLRALYLALRHTFRNHGKPAIIHAHVLLRPVLAAWILSRYLRIPFVITEHWTGFVYGGFRRRPLYYRLLSRRACSRAKAITVVSQGLKQAMIRAGIRNPQFLVIPNVVERTSFPLPIHAKRDVPLVLTVADMNDASKNISGAIRAIARLYEKYPGLEYHVIGGGKDEEILRELAASFDREGKWIFFHGRRDNDYVMQFMLQASFLLTNSRVETFSVASAEALALGKPVVATRSGGPEDFIGPENGILIDPDRPDQLDAALEKMLLTYRHYDPEKVTAGIMERFGQEAVTASFRDLYLKLLKQEQTHV